MNYYTSREKKLWKIIRDEERMAKYERLYADTQELALVAVDITNSYKERKPYQHYRMPYQGNDNKDNQ